MSCFRGQGRQRGVVLVLVLWVVVILSLIAYSLLFQSASETTMTSQRKKYLQAEALARSGLAKAIVDLRNDMIFDTAESENPQRFDAEGDVWARPEEGKIDAFPDDRGEGDPETGMFNVRVYDEQGYLNINRFNPQSMIILQKIAEKIGYEEEDAKLVAAAIVDWRDFDTVPAHTEASTNQEGIAYAVLRGEDEGGETDPDAVTKVVLRNEDLLTVDELLEVYGVTPELYFGPGSPEAEYYKTLLPERVGERFQIEEKRRRSDDEPILGLRDFFTVYGDGTLNINSAPEHVLAAFAEGGGNSDGDAWGERVVKIRRSNQDEDIDNGSAFKDMGAVSANAEVGGVVSVSQALYPVGVTSSVFRIVSVGEIGGVRCRIVAIVHRNLANLTRDESFEVTDRMEERRERNSARTERRTDVNDERVVRYPAVRIIQMRID
jgi:type II secretory pathway component PulK